MPVPAIDNTVSLRLKHGPQTVFLFVDLGSTLAQLGEQLLPVLQARFPNGLPTVANSVADVVAVPRPGETGFHFAFAQPRNQRQLDNTWLVLPDASTKISQIAPKLRDNAVLAFLIVRDGEPPVTAESFHMQVPTWDDEE